MNNELTEQLAARLHDTYYVAGGDAALSSLNDADEILSELGLDAWIAPDTLRSRLADLDAGEARTRQLLADAEQKRQLLMHTLVQIQGARQALKSLLEGGE
jgi:hypothetical protein